jgi:squalene synthase HpnC
MRAMSAAATTAPTRADVMAQAPAENFPVAARLLAGRARGHLLAIYGYARLVDDLGDEVDGDRPALLDWVDEELDRIYAGRAPEHPVMRALAPAIAACAMPEGPFRRLVDANRQDQRVTRYDTFEDLLAYCQLSAAPVGELVLWAFGAASADRVALSDRVCAALQVIEHVQDVGEDRARGRVYLPARDMADAGCRDEHLLARCAGPELRAVLRVQADRAGALLAAGGPLVRSLPARARPAVAGFVAGGRATLAALRAADFDVLGARPRRTRPGFAVAFARAVAGR